MASGTTRWQRRKRRLAKKKKEAHAETVVADIYIDVAGLATMPREILDEITDSIERLRDMGAWSIATGLPTKDRHLEAIETEHTSTEDVLKAGAPLTVIEPLFACRQVKPSTELAAASALGGRLDVYRHVGRELFVHGPVSNTVGTILPTLIHRGHIDVADDIASVSFTSVVISLRQRAEALMEALLGSHTALACKLHNHCVHWAWGGSCHCDESVLPRILEFDLPIALATLRRVGCHKAKCGSRSLFVRAIEAGALAVAKQLAEHRPAHDTPLALLTAAVSTAASKGHVDILAWLYKERHYEVSIEVLGAAARAGHLRIIEWAARAHNGRPIASWSARYIAYAAISGDQPEPIMEWLLTRRVDRRDLSVGVAKAALARHGIVIPLLLHKAGIAPFGTWDALEMAVDSGSAYAARVVVSNGGRCDLAVLARCLSRYDADMISLLADHYTPADIQTVLDSGLVGIGSWAPLHGSSTMCRDCACATPMPSLRRPY
ncbi:hypothetical protein TW95_gp1080 [Pandoravirus inopinatum]|uniref:Ankyrin repeat protein n=1 Tax=Pandoravirus inopinatum TaxID=1605721 RepID=A0A0B5J2M3_9VIRU|nr:hypothetical protein TW95_gp1080 [Pandoravirus inopinatum]AJF97814.1 hypothetical protein [Pandoravirus inopinatum]